MIGIKRPSQRFSLLLLDEGEYYFEDYSAFYYPDDNDIQSPLKRKVKGRLKLCSGSFIFDPEDIKLPIIKFPFRYVTAPIQQWQGSLKTNADVFVIKSTQTVEMKENNNNAPYVFKEETQLHKFSLNYVSMNQVLPLANRLLNITLQSVRQNTSTVFIHPELKNIIEEREMSISFDSSALNNLNERILVEKRGVRVTPLVNNPGKILITDSIIYFQPFNNVNVNPVEKFELESVYRIAKRRYVLRHVGLEIFLDSGESVFFTFSSPELRDMIHDILVAQPPVLRSLATDNQMHMTLKWQNGIISNYEYLMYLNSIAGRTFNDLTQYPIFPWVLADYTSPTLDLSNPKTFRELSKPIGALNPERLSMLKYRMQEMPTDPQNPPFLYGTHYSTPGYVLFFLVRQAPEYMLRLQNGKFDAPGRMFHSVSETWTGVLTNPADVKELIPEFYQLDNKGAFLINSERLYLGVKDNGDTLDDVVLPPWAKDAADFIAKMREALESDYVSENLHNWIDLIFGYKQQGPEAVKADNLFYHLTYEGAVDIDAIEDENTKTAIIAQIKEFGQTPKQLFDKPHLAKLPRNSEKRLREVPSYQNIPTEAEPLDIKSLTIQSSLPSWSSDIDKLKLSFSFKLHKDGITHMCLSHDASTLYSVSQDSSLKVYSLKDKRQFRSVNVCELTLSSCQLAPDEKVIIVGSWDNNIYVYSVDTGRIIDSVPAHDDSVSCICLRKDIIVSGAWDATVKVWQYDSNLSTIINKGVPLADFLDFESEVQCLDVDSAARFAAVGCADGNVVMLDLQKKITVRSLLLHSDNVNKVQFTPDDRRIVSCSTDQSIKVIQSSDGAELFSVEVGEKISCISTDGDILFSGGDNGIFRIWDLKSGGEIRQLKGNEPLSFISCSKDASTVVVGCQNGSIKVYTKPSVLEDAEDDKKV